MIIGGYTLDLYCDNDAAHPGGWYDKNTKFPIQFAADGRDSFSQARKMAKNSGWKLRRDGTCLCPKCKTDK